MKIFEISTTAEFEPWFFRLLFPNIILHLSPTFTDGALIYSICPLNKELYPNCETLFIKTDNGIPIYQASGFYEFLGKTDYLTKDKIQKIKDAYYFAGEQIPLKEIPDLFKDVLILKLTDCLRSDKLTLKRLLSALTLPLYERLNKILIFSEKQKTFDMLQKLIEQYLNHTEILQDDILEKYNLAFSNFNPDLFKQKQEDFYGTTDDFIKCVENIPKADLERWSPNFDFESFRKRLEGKSFLSDGEIEDRLLYLMCFFDKNDNEK